MFVDSNGNGERDAGEVLIKTMPATDISGTQRAITKKSGTNAIQFQAVGYAQGIHRIDILAHGDAAFELKYGRTVCISKPGRVRVGPPANVCN